jgi:hypothetical protein
LVSQPNDFSQGQYLPIPWWDEIDENVQYYETLVSQPNDFAQRQFFLSAAGTRLMRMFHVQQTKFNVQQVMIACFFNIVVLH